MARRLVSPTLIGRHEQLAAVERALDGAVAGTPIHQLVAGEAGVGKSRLVAEAIGLARSRGMRVLQGGCADIGDGGVPYGPIVEALRGLVRELDEETLERVVGSARTDLARLVPSLSPQMVMDPAAQTEALQARLLDAVLGMIQRLSEMGPILYVVEDLHWADPATRETLAFLIRQLRADRVVLLMTYRADELHRRHPLLPWLAELERSGQVDRLVLERLDETETTALLTAILGAPPTPDLAEQTYRRSDGNPFFVEELLIAGEESAAGRLPRTLREVLMTRIVALPEPTQAVIGVAAVAGRRVDHDLLAEVAAMGDVELMDALRTAVSSQILVTGTAADEPEGDYAFRHALLQEAVYDDLLPGERQRLHRSYAAALAERGPGGGALADRGPGGGALAAGHWAELAYHWSAARDERRAFAASIRAGEAASRAFAFADAQRHDERALELWASIPDAEDLAEIDRVALLDRAALASWFAGDPRRTVALRREAVAALDRHEDPIRRGVMLERLGRALWTNAETKAALEATEAAVAVMPADPPTPERARVLSGYGQMLMLLDQWSESIALCEQAIAMARAVGARRAEGHALTTLGLDLAMAGRCDDSVSTIREGLAIAHEVADADDIGRAYVNLSEAQAYCGDFAGAAEMVREGVAVTDEIGLARTYGRFIRENGITIAFELGDWAEAARLAGESIEVIEGSARHQMRYGLSQWVSLLVARGDERAQARLEALRSLVDGQTVESQFNTRLRIGLAEAALWRREPEVALAAAQEGLRELEDSGWHWFQLRLLRIAMTAAADLAEVARDRRDRRTEAATIETAEAVRATFQSRLDAARALQHGLDRDQTDAEIAVIEAEDRRMRGEPAAAAVAGRC